MVKTDMYSGNNLLDKRANDIRDYFLYEDRVDKNASRYNEAKILKEAVGILEGVRVPPHKKGERFRFLFSTSQNFENIYSFLLEYNGSNDFFTTLWNRIVRINEILVEFEENIDEHEKSCIKAEMKEPMASERAENYRHALYIVLEYIDYNDSPYLEDFLNQYGIDEKTFKFFINIILLYGGDLYDKYLEKTIENKMIRISETMAKLENLKTGIITGKLPNGEPFDSIEFYANVPNCNGTITAEIQRDFNVVQESFNKQRLRNLLFSVYRVEEETSNSCSFHNPYLITNEEKRKIEEYISMHLPSQMYSLKFINKFEESISSKMKGYSFGGITLSNDDKENITKYMKARNMMFYSRAFDSVAKEYLSGDDNKVKSYLETMEKKALLKQQSE